MTERAGLVDLVAAQAVRGGGRAGPPPERGHPRQQLAQAVGLGEVVVSAGLKALHQVVLQRARGEHQHPRGVAGRSQLTAQRGAVAVGQHQVQHHHVEALGGEGGAGGGERGGGHHAVALVFQVVGDGEAKAGVVLDDEDLRGHFIMLAPMGLSELLAGGTASFNAKRKRGEVPVDQSASTLSGLFFARADLSRLDLSNAELEDCTVSDVDFREANLSGAYLHGGRYERCDFRGAKLEGATLEQVEFVECDFTGATGLDSLEQEDVTGLGLGPAVEAPALEETPRFLPGHVAVNEALERELEAHPEDETRWLVYADWLQAQGDLRGELITRQHRGTGFEDFVAEHADQLFGSCADELRGGGQIPELVVEWRHGFVVGATLQALNPERAVNLGELVQRLLPLPVCRFLRRVSFGLNPQVTQYGEQQNDYAPVVNALIASPQLARLQRLEFGVQEPEIDDEYDEPEPLHAWGDLSALWPHVPQLRALLVKGSGGVFGELVLPELREVSFQLEGEDQELFSEVLAGELAEARALRAMGRCFSGRAGAAAARVVIVAPHAPGAALHRSARAAAEGAGGNALAETPEGARPARRGAGGPHAGLAGRSHRRLPPPRAARPHRRRWIRTRRKRWRSWVTSSCCIAPSCRPWWRTCTSSHR